MTSLRIRNWDKWQTYRKDRQQPPWIKLHRELMRNQDWVLLTDIQKAHIVSIWMLAADKNGQIPDDAAIIKKLCYLDSEPDLNLFIERGFIDARVTPKRRQHVTPARRHGDAPEADKEAEAEAEGDCAVVTAPSSVDSAFKAYNERAKTIGLPTAHKLTADRRRHIRARLTEHGQAAWHVALQNLDAPFLRGQNDRGWIANLDFMVQPKSFNRLIEGGYAGTGPPRGHFARITDELMAEARAKDEAESRGKQIEDRRAPEGDFLDCEYPEGEQRTGDEGGDSVVSLFPARAASERP